jgi:glutaminase
MKNFLFKVFLKLWQSHWHSFGWENMEASGSRTFRLLFIGTIRIWKGIPKSFINAGAIVIADMLVTHLELKQDFLDFIRMISGNFEF